MELRAEVEERRMSDDAERGKSSCVSERHSYSRASTALSRGPCPTWSTTVVALHWSTTVVALQP